LRSREDPSADDASDAERHEVDRCERLLETVRFITALSEKLVKRLSAEQKHFALSLQ
jgi:hypothetical protein